MLPWLLPGSFYVAIATHVLVAAVLALSLSAALNAPVGETRFGVFRM